MTERDNLINKAAEFMDDYDMYNYPQEAMADFHLAQSSEITNKLCNEHHEHQQCDLCDQQDMTLAAMREKAMELMGFEEILEFAGFITPKKTGITFREAFTALKAALEGNDG